MAGMLPHLYVSSGSAVPSSDVRTAFSLVVSNQALPLPHLSLLTNVWGKEVHKLPLFTQKTEREFSCVAAFESIFPHSDWLSDRMCNVASLSEKMTHNDFCYHLRMFRQNK